MRKLFSILFTTILIVPVLLMNASAATHTVVSGDTLWKLAVKYEIGISELKSANPQIKNFDLIYPGQTINIPTLDSTVTNYEQEVIRLVNQIRAENGLKALTYDWELARVARYKSQDMKDNK